MSEHRGASTTALDALAGRITLRPGAPLPNVARSRVAGIERLFRGRPAASLPDLLAAVFSLCGHAHRLTARMAIDAARGWPAPCTPHEARRLQWHTAHEQARRILIDWPGLLGGGAPTDADLLARCPVLRPGHGAAASLEALPAWLHADMLAMPPAQWLAGLDEGGEAWLADWCASTTTPAAQSLARYRERAQRIRVAVRPLRLHGDEGAQRRLAFALAHDAEFANAPIADDHCAETGAWTRHLGPLDGAAASVWLRLAARLADLACLALADGPAAGALWLCSGALHTGAGEAIAWTESARGLLVHWLRLDGDRVAACRVLAPTDWNFHPHGAVAQALAALPRGRDGADAAQLLAAAFDPCVAHDIALDEEARHA